MEITDYDKIIPTTDIRYRIEQELGEGSFGKVFKISIDPTTIANNNNFPKNQTEYALKIGSFKNESQENIFKREKFNIEKLRKINNTCYIYLVCYYLIVKDSVENKYYFISELMDMNTDSWMQKISLEYEENQIDKKKIKKLFDQFYISVYVGILDIHKLGLIHRDIKLENILFKDNSITPFKIADFGLGCSVFPSDFNCSKGIGGGLAYIDPAILVSGFNYATFEWDYYSFGMSLVYLYSGVFGTNFENLDKVLNDIVDIITDENNNNNNKSNLILQYEKLKQIILVILKDMKKNNFNVIEEFVLYNVVGRLNFIQSKDFFEIFERRYKILSVN